MKRIGIAKYPDHELPIEDAYVDEPALFLKWLDDESIGYTDFYPVSWFAHIGKRKGLIHLTRGPRGGIYQAKCDLEVSDRTALLDYEPYMEAFNEVREMLPGTAKLVFRKEGRTQLMNHAFWRKPGGAFARYSIAAGTVPSLRFKVSALDDLSAGEPIGTEKPKKRSGTTTFYIRNEKLRDAVRRRAKGRCEHCRCLGFQTAAGKRYLETHHIIALAAGGPDMMSNVIALCANHHREAHFGANAKELNATMLAIVQKLDANK